MLNTRQLRAIKMTANRTQFRRKYFDQWAKALSQQKGRILVFKPREIYEGENPSQKGKAVSGAVNS